MISLITANEEKRKNGFTLLELLIVISIIAILSIALVFLLNPAETLKKARDAQRISDLKTIKTALGVMLTASSTPSLDGTFAATAGICLTTGNGTAQAGKIAYSTASAPTWVTPPTPAISGGDAITGSTFTSPGSVSATAGKVDGTGWIPVNLKALVGGAPISAFPVDPSNTIGTLSATASTDFVYRYACQNGSSAAGKPAYLFEVDAVLESQAYTVDDNKMSKDGGDNTSYYESGSSLNLLPTSTTF